MKPACPARSGPSGSGLNTVNSSTPCTRKTASCWRPAPAAASPCNRTESPSKWAALCCTSAPTASPARWTSWPRASAPCSTCTAACVWATTTRRSPSDDEPHHRPAPGRAGAPATEHWRHPGHAHRQPGDAPRIRQPGAGADRPARQHGHANPRVRRYRLRTHALGAARADRQDGDRARPAAPRSRRSAHHRQLHRRLWPRGRAPVAVSAAHGPRGRRMIDLQTLPAPAVVEALSFEAILAEAKADFAERMRPHLPAIDDILALESDPVVKLIESHAYRELLIRARINDAARAHLLAFAADGDLDQLAALFGVLRMAGEKDDRLRARLQLKIAALGAQGTRQHYEYHAMTASALVRTAQASQPTPGAVLVTLWLTDQAQAEPVRAAVEAALNADDARMLGVRLAVQVAVPKAIHITARITRTASAPTNLLQQLGDRLAAAFAGLNVLASSVARSYITTLLHVDGVHAVDYPADDTPAAITPMAVGEYPVIGTVQLIDAGAA
ncbi:baseplate J family protein [Acidovorax phage Alfacinha3]|nr:baseplate J family protein [Acidovorax phage Alfacinha3]